MTPEEFGAFAKSLRDEKSWSLRKAAKELEVSHMRLGEIERGRSRGTERPTRPTRDLVQRMASAYGHPVDHLLELAGYAVERSPRSSRAALLLDLFEELNDDQQEMAVRIIQAIKGS